MPAPLVLASVSRYKAALLERLAIPFQTLDADIDESPLHDEAPEALALRLAVEKAREGARRSAPGSLVIGADQVATSDVIRFVGKPGSLEANHRQLMTLSGHEVIFHTAVALESTEGTSLGAYLDTTTVRFRRLTSAEVDAYLRVEPSPDCAGGCKVEGLGITLLQYVHSEDPTALIGLPLIALSKMLRDQGLSAD